MNCLKGRRHARVGDGRSQAVVRCCYKEKVSIRKGCYLTINLIVMMKTIKAQLHK
jgi:hypothetical protein